MSIFFVLSGFLITGFLWVRPNIRDFLIRRFALIMLSILLVSTVFCIILAWRPESFLALNLYYFNYDDGASSFARYVWHSPFRFGWFDPEETWYLIARPLGLAATFAIAHVSTFYFELVINRWAKKVTQKTSSSSRGLT